MKILRKTLKNKFSQMKNLKKDFEITNFLKKF